MQVIVKIATLQAVLLLKTDLAEAKVVVKQILYERINIFSTPVPCYTKWAPQKVLDERAKC